MPDAQCPCPAKAHACNCPWNCNTGVDEDCAEAAAWYQKASEQGDVVAKHVTSVAVFTQQHAMRAHAPAAVAWDTPVAIVARGRAQTLCGARGVALKSVWCAVPVVRVWCCLSAGTTLGSCTSHPSVHADTPFRLACQHGALHAPPPHVHEVTPCAILVLDPTL